MRRVLSTQVIAIVSGVFAAIIRKIVPAVVTLPAGNIRADYYAIALTQWDSFEVGVGFFPANRGNRADVLVSLNDGEFKRAIAVLRGVALKRVLVGSADSGHFHLDKHAPGSRLRQRIFPNFVLPGLYECCCEYACGRHIDSVDSSPILLFAKANRTLIPEGACVRPVAIPVSAASCYFLPISGSARNPVSEKAGQCVPEELLSSRQTMPTREFRPASRTEHD